MATTATSSQSASGTLTKTTFSDWRNRTTKREEYDEAKLRAHTLTASNWTDFRPWDVDTRPLVDVRIKGMSKWERLRAHNNDYWRIYREDVDVWASSDRRYKCAVVKHYAHYLGLSPVEEQRVFEDIMALKMAQVGHPVEVVVFCRCALEINRTAKRYGDKNIYHPQHQTPKDAEFGELEERLIEQYARVNKHLLTSIYNKLDYGSLPNRDRSEWWPYFRHDNLTPQEPSMTATFDPSLL